MNARARVVRSLRDANGENLLNRLLSDHSVDKQSFRLSLDLIEYAVFVDPQPIGWEHATAESFDPRSALQRGVDRKDTMASNYS
jgi:hypothetical protein